MHVPPNLLDSLLLGSFLYSNGSVIQGSPKLDTVLQMQSPKCHIQGKNNFLWSAACTFANTALSALAFFASASSYSNALPGTPILFCKSTFYPVGPPSLHCCMGLFCPGMRPGISLCWTPWGSCRPISPAYQGPSWIAALLYQFGRGGLQTCKFCNL